jgi:hypothetical protein
MPFLMLKNMQFHICILVSLFESASQGALTGMCQRDAEGLQTVIDRNFRGPGGKKDLSTLS